MAQMLLTYFLRHFGEICEYSIQHYSKLELSLNQNVFVMKLLDLRPTLNICFQAFNVSYIVELIIVFENH